MGEVGGFWCWIAAKVEDEDANCGMSVELEELDVVGVG